MAQQTFEIKAFIKSALKSGTHKEWEGHDLYIVQSHPNHAQHLWFITPNGDIYCRPKAAALLQNKLKADPTLFQPIPQKLKIIHAAFHYYIFTLKNRSINESATWGSSKSPEKCLRSANLLRKFASKAYEFGEYRVSVDFYQAIIGLLNNNLSSTSPSELKSASISTETYKQMIANAFLGLAKNYFAVSKHEKVIMYSKQSQSYDPSLERPKVLKQLSLDHIEEMKQLSVFDHFGQDKGEFEPNGVMEDEVMIYCLKMN